MATPLDLNRSFEKGDPAIRRNSTEEFRWNDDLLAGIDPMGIVQLIHCGDLWPFRRIIEVFLTDMDKGVPFRNEHLHILRTIRGRKQKTQDHYKHCGKAKEALPHFHLQVKGSNSNGADGADHRLRKALPVRGATPQGVLSAFPPSTITDVDIENIFVNRMICRSQIIEEQSARLPCEDGRAA